MSPKSSKKKPSAALLKDLNAVLEKHGLEGTVTAIGQPAGASLTAAADGCPPNTTPHNITVKLPNGTWVTKTVCL